MQFRRLAPLGVAAGRRIGVVQPLEIAGDGRALRIAEDHDLLAVGGAVVLVGLALARQGDRSEKVDAATWPDAGAVQGLTPAKGERLGARYPGVEIWPRDFAT